MRRRVAWLANVSSSSALPWEDLSTSVIEFCRVFTFLTISSIEATFIWFNSPNFSSISFCNLASFAFFSLISPVTELLSVSFLRSTGFNIASSLGVFSDVPPACLSAKNFAIVSLASFRSDTAALKSSSDSTPFLATSNFDFNLLYFDFSSSTLVTFAPLSLR